jgi:hypothetical protein
MVEKTAHIPIPTLPEADKIVIYRNFPRHNSGVIVLFFIKPSPRDAVVRFLFPAQIVAPQALTRHNGSHVVQCY